MKKSFTLIEMLVVIAVVSLVVPAIFAIIFGIMRGETKVYRLSRVKEEGDFVLNTIANTVRNNALTLHSATPISDANTVCRDAGTSASLPIYFVDQEGQWFNFSSSANYIASDSANFADPLNLNSSRTVVSNLTMSCDRDAVYSGATVSLSFDVCYYNASDTCPPTVASIRPEEKAWLHYQTKIKLRNF